MIMVHKKIVTTYNNSKSTIRVKHLRSKRETCEKMKNKKKKVANKTISIKTI